MLGKLVKFDNVLFVFLSSIEQHRNSMHTTYCMFFAEETSYYAYIYIYIHSLYNIYIYICSVSVVHTLVSVTMQHHFATSTVNRLWMTCFSYHSPNCSKKEKTENQTSKHPNTDVDKIHPKDVVCIYLWSCWMPATCIQLHPSSTPQISLSVLHLLSPSHKMKQGIQN